MEDWTKDLTIGDLVYDGHKHVCRITEIIGKTSSKVGMLLYGIDPVFRECVHVLDSNNFTQIEKIENLTPIPLSEEILLQLGWEQRKLSSVTYYAHSVTTFPDIMEIHEKNRQNPTFLLYAASQNISYLHQLQQYMRSLYAVSVKYEWSTGFFFDDRDVNLEILRQLIRTHKEKVREYDKALKEHIKLNKDSKKKRLTVLMIRSEITSIKKRIKTAQRLIS